MREAHDENAPISQPSTSSQKASGGSEKSELRTAGGNLESELSHLNLQDASLGGVAAATAQARGNNHQGASGVSSKPQNPDSGTSRGSISRSEETQTQVQNVPEPANTDVEVRSGPNSETSGDGFTHTEQTRTQVPDTPEAADTDGGVPTDVNSEAYVDGTHSEETHSQVLNVPDPVNASERDNPDSTAAAAAAAAAETVPLHPVETNLESLTGTPIQEEAADTVATSSETAPAEEAANNYDHLYGK